MKYATPFRNRPLKQLLLAALLLLPLLAPPAAGVTLEPDTPFFDAPSPQANILSVTAEALELPPDAPVRRVFIARHPLARYSDFYTLALPDGRNAYAAPDLRMVVNSQGRQFVLSFGVAPLWRQVLLLAAVAALLLLGLHYYKGHRDGSIRPDSAAEAWCFAGFLVLTRQILLLIMVMAAGNVICSAADDPGYFQVAYDLLQGRVDGPWSYPIGLGVLLYLPAICLTGAREFYDVAIGVSYVSGLVFAPLSLALGFALLRRLGLGGRAALTAAGCWALLPFLIHYVPDWTNHIFVSAPALPSAEPTFRHYTMLIGAGFNGMSDTLSTLLVLGTLYIALRLPPRLGSVAVAAAIFALACLVRLNNIFFAPVTAWLLYLRHRERLADPRYLLAGLLTGAGCYLALLAPQFWINHHQFGSIFTFSYTLHYTDWAAGSRPVDGFTWHTLSQWTHVRFLGGSNFAVWALGIAGLLTLPDRRIRVALSLWALPVILFFFGYSHTFCDGTRFILSSYLPLFAAFAGGTLWTLPDRRERWTAAATVLFTILLTVPLRCHAPWMLPWDWQRFAMARTLLPYLLVLPLCAGALLIRRRLSTGRARDAAACLGVFLLLYAAADALWLGVLLAMLCARAVVDVFRVCVDDWKPTRA